MNKKLLLKVLLFNILEIISVFIIGVSLKIKSDYIIAVVLLFPVSRFIFKKPMHYKSPYLCYIITLAIFVSLFLILHVNIIISLIITVFSGYILTDNANICDMFMWSGRSTQYQDIIDYIKNNSGNKLKEFEKRLSEQDTLSYLVYKYRFKDKLSFQKISDIAQYEGTLFDKREFVRNYLDRTYKRLNGIQDSVGYVSSMFPNNTLLITMKGHITCSKPSEYGPTIYDTFDCRSEKVEDVWLVN